MDLDVHQDARLRGLLGHVTMPRLEWLAVLAPLAFLGLYYYLMLGPLHHLFHSWYGFLLLWLLLTAAVMLFARAVFGAIRSMQASIDRLHEETRHQNDQLIALHEATLALSQETEVAAALQQVVDLSARLVGSGYAALAVVDEHGVIEDFLTYGVDAGTRGRIGHLPEGRGLIGELLQNPRVRLRVDAIADHPASVGFPVGHPPMHALLGVSVVHRGTVLGALYLTEKDGGEPFSTIDEEIVGMFATHAGVILQNAHLYQEVQALAVERERQHIAREMHDGLAQVLGFVNTKAQAAERFLRNGDPVKAQRHLAELSGAAREGFADIREGIVALRTQSGNGRTLREVVEEYVEEYRHFAHLPVELRWELDEPDPRLGPTADVQLVRILQEALTNVRRHAQASHARITVQRDGDDLVAEVRDDGRGFDPDHMTTGEWPHFGLQSMHGRAESAAGHLVINSAPGAGTTVRARFPLAAASALHARDA